MDAAAKGPATGPNAPPKGGFPVITTTAPITIHFNGEEVVFLPLKPAHTDADMAVYFKKSDVFVFGDVYRTDYPSIGDVEGATVYSFLDDYQMALDMTTRNHADGSILQTHAIYRLNGNVLTYCVGAPGEQVRSMQLELAELYASGTHEFWPNSRTERAPA